MKKEFLCECHNAKLETMFLQLNVDRQRLNFPSVLLIFLVL